MNPYDAWNLTTTNIPVTDRRITVTLAVLPVLTLLEETEIQYDTSAQEFAFPPICSYMKRFMVLAMAF